ncbi:hypothetical protein DVH05_013805 [Phytophthora capsici]|nr:hypothetical protein DVH05_013805 [Phytophthora capsici]
MTVLGVSVLLFASAFVLVNLVRVPIYDESLKDSISVFEAPSTGTATPMQIHVALAGEVTVKTYSAIRSSIAAESETRLGMTISWATDVKTATSSVRYGLSKNDLSVVQQSEEPCEQYDFCQEGAGDTKKTHIHFSVHRLLSLVLEGLLALHYPS